MADFSDLDAQLAEPADNAQKPSRIARPPRRVRVTKFRETPEGLDEIEAAIAKPMPKGRRPKPSLDPDAPLTPKEDKFVAVYMATQDKRRAVIEAGYGVKKPETTALRLLKKPNVRRAIDSLRLAVADKVAYEVKDALRELDETIAFAKKTGNATAYARAVELKARISGLIIEKKDMRVAAGFQVIVEGMDD